MISICTVIADVFGRLTVKDSNDSSLPSILRSSYVATTLGGNVVVQDYGLAIGADTMSFDIDFNEINERIASRIGKTHSMVTVSYRSGFYKAAVKQVSIDKEKITITLTPTELVL